MTNQKAKSRVKRQGQKGPRQPKGKGKTMTHLAAIETVARPTASSAPSTTSRKRVSWQGPRSYALRMETDEMSPVIKEGYLLMTNPDRPVEIKDTVCVEFQDGARSIRSLMAQTKRTVTLRQYNPQIDTKMARSEIKFMHVVTAAVIRV